MKKRGTIAIYASKTLTKSRFEYCNENRKIKVAPEDLPFGAIIGFVDVVDVITKKELTRKTEKWFSGDFGYVLANPIMLKAAVPAKPPSGAIKFWELKGKTLTNCLKQLSIAQANQIRPFE